MLGQSIFPSWKSHHVKGRRCSYYSKKLSRQFLRWLVGGERENYSCNRQAAASNQRTNINWASPSSNPSRQAFLLQCHKEDFMFCSSENQKGIWEKSWTNSGRMYRLLSKCLWFAVCSYHAKNATRSFFGWYSFSVALWQACDLTPTSCVAQFAEVKNPIVLQGRGRPLLASNNSTHRDLLDLNWLKMQILGVILATVLWEEQATTPRPVLNAPESR